MGNLPDVVLNDAIVKERWPDRVDDELDSAAEDAKDDVTEADRKRVRERLREQADTPTAAGGGTPAVADGGTVEDDADDVDAQFDQLENATRATNPGGEAD